jgi:hypothetical protein
MTARAAEKSIYIKEQENYAHIKQLLPAMDIISPLHQPLAPLPSIRIFLSLKTFRRRVGLSTKQGTIFGNRRSFFVRNFKF